jgi:predicted GNAT superfamily acetyltransferase
VPAGTPLPDANPVLIEIPGSINDTKRQSHDAGVRWRESTRRAFQYYLARGMVVSGFQEFEAGRFAYVMKYSTP